MLSNYQNFLRMLKQYRQNFPGQRKGQSYFNLLLKQHPDIANELRGTSLDPFYDDEILSSTETWVIEKLDGE